MRSCRALLARVRLSFILKAPGSFPEAVVVEGGCWT